MIISSTIYLHFVADSKTNYGVSGIMSRNKNFLWELLLEYFMISFWILEKKVTVDFATKYVLNIKECFT